MGVPEMIKQKTFNLAMHRIAHWLGWNYGNVETFWQGERLMVGFRCSCGELSGVEECFNTKQKRLANAPPHRDR